MRNFDLIKLIVSEICFLHFHKR